MGLFWGFDCYLEGKSLFALRLPADDDDTYGREQTQNDKWHYDACISSLQPIVTGGQDNAQQGD